MRNFLNSNPLVGVLLCLFGIFVDLFILSATTRLINAKSDLLLLAGVCFTLMVLFSIVYGLGQFTKFMRLLIRELEEKESKSNK